MATEETESQVLGSENLPLSLIMSPRALVVKANDLVEARQRLSIQEQRIILLLISKIRPEDVDFLWYKFQIRDLAKFLGIETSKRFYTDVRKAVRKLIKRVITVDKKGRNIDLNCIQAAEYGEKGFVKICINQVLKPYLLKLTTHFTKYYIGYVVHLRSTYSIRIYELLKRFENLGEVTFEIHRLKHILGLEKDEYPLYGNFKNKVILVAQRELAERTDVAFTFTEMKEGKRVTSLRFFIAKNTPKEQLISFPEPPAIACEAPIEKSKPLKREAPSRGSAAPPPKEEGDTEENFNRLVAMLPEKFRKMQSLERLIAKALQQYGFDFVARNINYSNVKSNASKPGTNPMKRANYGAYLAKALAGDFGLTYQENEEVTADERAAEEKRRQEEAEKKREEAKRQAKDTEDRERAETILQALSESDISAIRKEAEGRIPPHLQGKYSSMVVKLEMHKIVLERMAPKPPAPPTQDPSPK